MNSGSQITFTITSGGRSRGGSNEVDIQYVALLAPIMGLGGKIDVDPLRCWSQDGMCLRKGANVSITPFFSLFMEEGGTAN